MSIERARKLLGKKYSNLSDDQIQEVINNLYNLAEIIVETASKKLKINNLE